MFFFISVTSVAPSDFARPNLEFLFFATACLARDGVCIDVPTEAKERLSS
jgi:hypothetical protein